jgi:hypothetical protein
MIAGPGGGGWSALGVHHSTVPTLGQLSEMRVAEYDKANPGPINARC